MPPPQQPQQQQQQQPQEQQEQHQQVAITSRARKTAGGIAANGTYIPSTPLGPSHPTTLLTLPHKMVVKAIKTHQARFPNDLSFEMGDFFYVVDESNEYYYEVVDTMYKIRGNVPKKLFEVLEKVSQRSAATFVDANGLDPPIDEAYTPPPPQQQQQQQQQIIPPNKQQQQCTLIPEFGAPPAWASSGRPPAGYGDYADENIGYKWPVRVNTTVAAVMEDNNATSLPKLSPQLHTLDVQHIRSASLRTQQSLWDTLPLDIIYRILNLHSSQLTRYLNACLTPTETRLSAKAIWAEAISEDWPGDFAALPFSEWAVPTALTGLCTMRSRHMYDSLKVIRPDLADNTALRVFVVNSSGYGDLRCLYSPVVRVNEDDPRDNDEPCRLWADLAGKESSLSRLLIQAAMRNLGFTVHDTE
ncbi:hypothetical protein HK405_007412 [Cladochytrium tenue]|nr:hypothetical protein HK405_007412 [Cladochytrium tenue]